MFDHSSGILPLKLSVLMPVHNEKATIEAAAADVLNMKLGHPFELVIIDDGSTDGTGELLSTVHDPRVVVHQHPTNLGKGAAVLSGSALATGTHLVIFDADREYSAADLVRLFEPIVDDRAQVVFGVRMFGMNTVYQSYRYALGNRVTTLVANVLFDACLSDLHSCLKMLPVDLFRSLSLKESGFGLDSEITAELLRRGYRPFEIPVSYFGRSHAQGKKLTWRDGLGCLVVLSRVRMRGRPGDRVPDLTPGAARIAAADVVLTGVGDNRNVISLRDRRSETLEAAMRLPKNRPACEVVSDSSSD
jgi:glycosyltransferase involved in cell wall biosynthesis